MTNLETNFLEVLTREAVRFCSRAVRLFTDAARANSYGPHTGLSFMALQIKRMQGRTGHMINPCILREVDIINYIVTPHVPIFLIQYQQIFIPTRKVLICKI